VVVGLNFTTNVEVGSKFIITSWFNYSVNGSFISSGECNYSRNDSYVSNLAVANSNFTYIENITTYGDYVIGINCSLFNVKSYNSSLITIVDTTSPNLIFDYVAVVYNHSSCSPIVQSIFLNIDDYSDYDTTINISFNHTSANNYSLSIADFFSCINFSGFNCYENNLTTNRTFNQTGTYTIFTYVNDSAGNVNSSSATFTVSECVVIGIDCEYNPTPFLKEKIPIVAEDRDKIFWLCTTDNNYNCTTKVYKQEQMIQSNPKMEYIERYGAVEYFSTKGDTSGVLKAYFKKKNLLPNENYNFCLECGAGDKLVQINKSVTPTYKDLRVLAYRGVWIKDNMPLLFGLLLFVVLSIIAWQIYTKK